MINRFFYKIFLLVIVCVASQSNLAGAQPVSGRILDGVTIGKQADEISVQVNFNFPIRYLSHFPDASGRELRIQLQPISVSSDDREALSRRESYSPKRNNPANISEIIYEGDGFTQLFLTIYFKSQTDFSVRQGNDFRSLEILVKPRVLDTPFAINLESTPLTIDIKQVPALPIIQQHTLYISSAEIDGKLWHRLRLGFFADNAQADEVLQKLQSHYPEAWVTKVSRTEIETALKSTLTVATPTESPAMEPVETPSATAPKDLLPVEKAKRLLADGEAAMLEKNYSRAAIIYGRLVEKTDGETSQQALEYLGLARERANQLAHAKATYEKYLTLYPQGDGAERVKQRLAGIITAAARPRELRAGKAAQKKSVWQTDFYGSFSQFYDRDESYTNNVDAVVNQSSLTSDLDLNARFRSEDYDIRLAFSGGYENDFLDEDDNRERISSLYIDALAHQLNLSTRIGRQSRSTGGVLGRFDGAWVSWQALDKVGINLVGGYPVASSREIEIDTARPLYGISFDLGTFVDHWDINTFYITQDVDGIIDREAIGGEIRFFHPDFSSFTLVDYDISYNQLNTVLFNGNWKVTDKTTLNFSADYRQSPILTTSNALQGQTATSISQLQQSFSESEIRQLALDRTTIYRSYTLGVTHSFNEKLQINADVTASKLSGTPSSGGVEGYEGTGFEYYYSLQFIGSSLIKQGDIAIIGLRYSDSSNYSSYSFNLNTRYPITNNLRINPRFLVDYRTAHNSSNEQLKFRPLVRLEYRWKRAYNLELETGLEFSTDKTSDTVDDRRGYFATIGYRIDF